MWFLMTIAPRIQQTAVRRAYKCRTARFTVAQDTKPSGPPIQQQNHALLRAAWHIRHTYLTRETTQTPPGKSFFFFFHETAIVSSQTTRREEKEGRSHKTKTENKMWHWHRSACVCGHPHSHPPRSSKNKTAGKSVRGCVLILRVTQPVIHIYTAVYRHFFNLTSLKKGCHANCRYVHSSLRVCPLAQLAGKKRLGNSSGMVCAILRRRIRGVIFFFRSEDPNNAFGTLELANEKKISLLLQVINRPRVYIQSERPAGVRIRSCRARVVYDSFALQIGHSPTSHTHPILQWRIL